jgi:hypothetical protein
MAEAARGESKRLLRRIQVMELESCGKAVIAARCTAAAGLLHQDPLDPAPPLGDPLLGT